MGHRLLSNLGSLKLYPPLHSVIQTHTQANTLFSIDSQWGCVAESSGSSATEQICPWSSRAHSTLAVQPDGFQSSSACAPSLSEHHSCTFLKSCFPSFLAIYANSILKNTHRHYSFLAKLLEFFVVFIFYWFRNAFALNTSANFFLWHNISSGRSILRWLAGVPNTSSKPYLPQVLNYLSW